jgi:Flp pilus assembly protein TadG
MVHSNARSEGERGAILVHVAIAMIGLLVISALAVDFGVLWTGRRQAQNAADAAALSGATSLAFRNPDDLDGARAAAVATGQVNQVWGQAPAIADTDIAIGACPPGSPGLPDTCLRADVYRNQARANPLPTFFARLVDVNDQGVRATATAQVAVGTTARCLRPWMIPDRWYDVVDDDNPKDAIWTNEDRFERRVEHGPSAGQLLPPEARDAYFGPLDGDIDAPWGFNRPYPGFDPFVDRGVQVVLKAGNPQQAINAGWFFPVDLPIPGDPDTGGDRYRKNIYQCNSDPVTVGDVLVNEPGNMIGPTGQGVDDLIAQDPSAAWSDACDCVVGSAHATSPRIVPVPVFSAEEYDTQDRSSGRFQVRIVKLVGMFVEPMRGNDVVGRLMPYPVDLGNGVGPQDPSSFLRTVILVR